MSRSTYGPAVAATLPAAWRQVRRSRTRWGINAAAFTVVFEVGIRLLPVTYHYS